MEAQRGETAAPDAARLEVCLRVGAADRPAGFPEALDGGGGVLVGGFRSGSAAGSGRGEERARLGQGLPERLGPGAVLDEVEEVAVIARGPVGPFAGPGAAEADEQRLAAGAVDVAGDPVAALALAGGKVMPADGLGLGGEGGGDLGCGGGLGVHDGSPWGADAKNGPLLLQGPCSESDAVWRRRDAGGLPCRDRPVSTSRVPDEGVECLHRLLVPVSLGVHGFAVSVCVGSPGGLLGIHGFLMAVGFRRHGRLVALVTLLAGLGHLVDAAPYDADLQEADEEAGSSEDICGGDKVTGGVRNGCLRGRLRRWRVRWGRTFQSLMYSRWRQVSRRVQRPEARPHAVTRQALSFLFSGHWGRTRRRRSSEPAAGVAGARSGVAQGGLDAGGVISVLVGLRGGGVAKAGRPGSRASCRSGRRRGPFGGRARGVSWREKRRSRCACGAWACSLCEEGIGRSA